MTQQRRSQWAVVGLNGAVVVTVIVLVAVVALVVKPPAPPGIAAFAPQAAKAITKAPQQQTSQNGDSSTNCVAGQVCASGSPSPSPAPSASAAGPSAPPKQLTPGVPSSLQCYTWPDGTVTQTFDPQSPPCIAGWDDKAGNGGKTSAGVTGTEVRIAFPQGKTITNWPQLQPLVDFVNSHFQLYGRKIRIVPFQSQQAEASKVGTDLNDPAKQRADAAQITQLGVFASMDFVDPVPYDFSLPGFRQTLTQHKIISVGGGEVPVYGTDSGLASNAPYEWSYQPTMDRLMANVGTMTCRQLINKPASHTLDTTIQKQTRKFALMLPADDLLGGPPPGLGTLLATLKGCGITDPKVVRFDTTDQASATKASMTQLHKDGVTSLIFFPTVGSAQATSPMSAAGAVKFYPEWITIGWNRYLTDVQTSTKSQKQLRAMFGVGDWNKESELGSEFWTQSFVAGGGESSAPAQLNDGRAFYNELLLLASGIQMAGPKLTPQTFADGLHQTTFGNPGAGAAPSYQATVGFAGDSTSMMKDYTAFWMSPEAGTNTINGGGIGGLNTYRAECYAGLGRRWSLDTWPTVDPFYQGGCR